MFVENRTTHTEVLDQVVREVKAQANRVINDAINHRDHPTFITKTMARENVHRLAGAYELARRVLGEVPTDLDDHVTRANQAFAQEWGK